MAEMTDRDVSERLGRYRARRTVKNIALRIAMVVVAAAAIIFAMQRADTRNAALAEKARVESVLKKPLQEWSEAERAEFPDEFESRRQAERALDPTLWTAAEKKAEWWSYTKLLVKNKFAHCK